MPASDLLDVKADLVDRGEPLPTDDAAFDVDLLPGFTEGDWPEWPEQKMLDWLPAKICREYGQIESSVLNGQSWRRSSDLVSICAWTKIWSEPPAANAR